MALHDLRYATRIHFVRDRYEYMHLQYSFIDIVCRSWGEDIMRAVRTISSILKRKLINYNDIFVEFQYIQRIRSRCFINYMVKFRRQRRKIQAYEMEIKYDLICEFTIYNLSVSRIDLSN